ncbi:MAG TPA: CGNR zinc finger domain-containing protein [Terriglobales bacterium]|nr:CGNR zinc finger domain-containing protein [Terriglobales bacterium]
MERSIPSTQDFQFIGGSLALDFVNTVGNRLGQARDYFATPRDVVRWAAMPNCLPHLGLVRIRRGDMASIGSRREYLYELFLPFAKGTKPNVSRMLAALNLDIRQLWSKKTLRHTDGRVRWVFDGSAAEQLAHAIVSDAADLLSSGRCALIRQCQDDSCGWLYLDRSREKNRRWCSMRDCGNRAKARRFYAQHHGKGAA